MTPDTRFENRLLTELRAHVERTAPDADPAPAPGHRRAIWRPAPIAAAGGVLAAAATAVILATGGDGADPAYAVTPQTDGSVTVSVASLDDAAGLEQALRDAGVNAVVRTVPAGKMCKPQVPRNAPDGAQRTAMSVSGTSVQGGKATFTVSAGDIRDAQTLLITTSGSGTGPSSVSFAMVDAGDTSCELVDAPAPPEPGAGVHSQGGFVTSGAAGGKDAGPATSDGP